MDTETATNPVGGDDTLLSTVADDTGVTQDDHSNDQPELDENGEPIERQPEDDSEEVEHDGQKYKVPKALKDAFLRQADYTRKTQELAETRKAFDAERQTFSQASQQEVAALAQVHAIDSQITQYQRVDWDAWEQQDPFTAQSEWRKFQQLQQTRQKAAGDYTRLSQQRQFEKQQLTAKQIEEGRAVLAKDIPGWGDELAGKLMDTGAKQYGFSRAELETFNDPRMVKVLHDAHQWQSHQVKQKAAQRHEVAQQVQPAAKTAGNTVPAGRVDDRLSVDEWMRRRTEQVRKRA